MKAAVRDRRRTALVPQLLGAGLSVVLLAGCSAAASPRADRSPGSSSGSSPTASPSGTRSGDPSASASSNPASPTPSPSASGGAELPGGGRTILPGHRVVAYYGNATSAGLGVLGRTSPDVAAERLAHAAAPFATPGHPVLGAFELIATVANGTPTSNGDYSTPASDADVARYLAAARRHHLLLVLDVQPGRADFLSCVRRYERWLLQPDVSIALDPEWSMGPGQVPGRTIGSTSAATVNAVSAYVSGLVQAHHLPQKLFVLHQFRTTMISDRSSIVTRPGLATVFHIDGFGYASTKQHVYAQLHATQPFYNGFKLFYRQDKGLMSPTQVLALQPAPDLVSYQ